MVSKESGRIHWSVWVLIGICIVGCGILIWHFEKTDRNRYGVLSEQKANSRLDAQFPRLLYANAEYILIEDNQGIYKYSLQNECITGFCEFEKLGLGGMEGEDATYVQVSKEGDQVYLQSLKPNAELQYVYDVMQDSVRQFDGEPDPDMLSEMREANQEQVNTQYTKLGCAYQVGDETVFLAFKNEDTPIYADILYVVMREDHEKIYTIFGES